MKKAFILICLVLALSLGMISTSFAFDAIKKGDKGDTVVKIQSSLIEKGYLSGVADGAFGSGTEAAVIQFQTDNALDATGIVGEATYNLLVGTTDTEVSTADSDNSEVKDAGEEHADSIETLSELTDHVFTEGDYEYVELSDGTLQIVKYLGNEDKPAVDKKVNGMLVTEIGKKAFADNDAIEKLYMWADIRFFGDESFKGCDKLIQIDIPKDTKHIGYSCFEGCSSLKKVYMWADLKEIQERAFKDCVKLEKIDINKTLESVGKSAFENCTSLKKIYFWGGKRLEANAFKNCTALESTDIPKEMVYVGAGAYSGCSKLEKVYIWSDNVEVVENAFEGCKYQLDPDDVTIIPIPNDYQDTTADTSQVDQADAASDNVQESSNEIASSETRTGIRPEFKEAMDSYEAFFDEYIKFLENYDSSDLSALLEYASFLEQYSETMDKIDEIDESSLSPEEDDYYIEVMLRIDQKLIIATSMM